MDTFLLSRRASYLSRQFSIESLQMLPLHLYLLDIPSCGRFDASSISEQTCMELLVGDIKYLSIVQSIPGSFLDIKYWRGVDITDDYVIKISFNQRDIFSSEDDFVVGPGGRIDLRWLPSKLTWLGLSDMRLEGTIETADLPRDLRYVDLSRNRFEGTFCIKGLPENIDHLFIDTNQLSGSLHLEHLPPKAVVLNAQRNRFEGTLDFGHLPECIETLNLSDNKFSGTIDLSNIPSSLDGFFFNRAQISQDTLVISVPTNGLARFFVDKGRFDRIVDTNGRDIKSMLYPLGYNYL